MANNAPIPLPGDSLMEWRMKYPGAADELIQITNRLFAMNLRLVSPGTQNVDRVLIQNPDQFTIALPLLIAADYGTPTGTYTRTAFATTTVTTSQLAERVAALIADLKTIGILKP